MKHNIKKDRKYFVNKKIQFNFTKKKSTHYVIDLRKTLIALQRSLRFIEKMAMKGETILLIGTKPEFKEILKYYGRQVNQPFLDKAWVYGILSNPQILDIKIPLFGNKLHFKSMNEYKINKLTKQFLITHSGCVERPKVPGLVIFLNTSDLTSAIKEMNLKNIASTGLVSTTTSLEILTYPIPANDESYETIEFFVTLIIEVIKNGYKKCTRL
jgi:small subunit ribosomal protein S2